MTSVDLRITEPQWAQLREQCKISFRPRLGPETGVIGLLGESRAGGKHEFLVVKLLTPGPRDFKISDFDQLVFDASYIRRAHLEMRSEQLAGLVLVHTHPAADKNVAFSLYDNQQEPLLVENLQEIEPRTQLVSIVLGKGSHCGRLWRGSASVQTLRDMIVVGERLSFLSLDGRCESPPPSPSAVFDRGVALTGAGALALLSQLKVAVIGASGTGSLFCELLVRAGCRDLLLIDDDIVKVINLNRILYATHDDVIRKTPKVHVLCRGIDSLGLDCRVEPVQGNILDRDVLARLREADIVIGCVDKAFPRQLLCEFAFRYHRPYIDVGSEIGGDLKGIVSLDARTSYVAPGRPCLQCAGVVTPRQLRFESLSAEERERVRGQGYSNDLIIDQPAVMDLNMRAASGGMIVLRHLLQPFLLTPLPVMILENMVTYSARAVQNPRASNANCPVCQRNPKDGYADCAAPLGFDKQVVASLVHVAA